MCIRWLKKARDKAIRLKSSMVNAVGKEMDTVTGKAVMEQVDKFAQEYDAVNTAIVTQIYYILDRQAKLEKEITYKTSRRILIISLVWNAISTVAIIYILARGK